ncbi:MAG: lipoprotein insertase outer membrane protein LolB [Burkholderiales bacterium]|nr:outer membrane lipoprotein LolB [Burkholderiales bacterium]
MLHLIREFRVSPVFQPSDYAQLARSGWAARRARLLLALSSLFLVASCAVTRSIPDASQPIVQSPIAHFELSGRLAVRYDDQGFSGNVRWEHGRPAALDRIFLNSPLGQTVAFLERDATGVTLVADQQTHRAVDAESLTRDVLGWTLPLTGLEHWVLGRVAPENTPSVIERDNAGRLTSLTQNAWRITFPRYGEEPHRALPSRIDLQYGTLEIKLIIDDWNVE